jgi:hypothetical protein
MLATVAFVSSVFFLILNDNKSHVIAKRGIEAYNLHVIIDRGKEN